MKYKSAPLRVAETESQAFIRHMNEVRIVMQQKTKTELVQIVAALLVDNKLLKDSLEAKKPFNKLTKTLKRIFHV